MLSRQECLAWWGQVTQRPGWSCGIAKHKWMWLQGLILLPIALIVSWCLVIWTGLGVAQALSATLTAPIITGLFCGHRWEADQALYKTDNRTD